MEELDIEKDTGAFVQSIHGLSTTLPMAVTFSTLAYEALSKHHREFLEKYGKQDEEKGKGWYRLPLERYRENEQLKNKMHRVLYGANSLPNIFLVSLVSEFDYFFGRLIRWYFNKVPAALKQSDKSLTFSDLMAFDEICAAKEFLIEKEIEAVLRKSHADQFSWFEQKLGIPLRKDLSIWSVFIEVTERRNLFVHANGVVSHQYLRVCKEHGVDVTGVSIGQKLSVTPAYFLEAANAIIEIGVKLSQVLWRRVSPDEIAKADSALNDIAYNLLENEKYELSKLLLDFACETLPRRATERTSLTFAINRAQTYKWLGDEAKCRGVLDGIDWSAAAIEFQICVAALKEDYKLAASLMSKGNKSEPIMETDYKDWPVFKKFRETEEFKFAFKNLFGHELAAVEGGSAKEADKFIDALKTFEIEEFVKLTNKTETGTS